MRVLKNGIVAAAFLGLVAACKRKSNRSLLPRSLGGLRLAKVIVNGVARDDLTEPRYGPEFRGYDNLVGVYGEREPQVRVYFTRFSTSEEAAERLSSRIETLKSGLASEFRDVRSLERNGIAIYRVTGSGLIHILFQQATRTVWISAPPELGARVLTEFLRWNE